MYKIQTLNKISNKGLNIFDRETYEIAGEIVNPDAVLVRSADMLNADIPASVKSIARAGAGVNNIPIAKCTDRGIAVFNTPGANANAVKELVIAGMLLSARKIVDGIVWTRAQTGKGDELHPLVEKSKSTYGGTEIKGKKLGIIGLGAIGVMVANDALAMGMEVIGYDPYITIDNAWGMDHRVQKSNSLDLMLSEADYITIHVPLNDGTKGLLNREKFSLMKKGVKILNFARGGLVNNADLIEAIKNGRIGSYVCDFPEEELLAIPNVICMPHLGASTEEAEENCAVMAVSRPFSISKPETRRTRSTSPTAIFLSPRNTAWLSRTRTSRTWWDRSTTLLAKDKINIADMLNKHKGEIAYNLINLDSPMPESVVDEIRQIEGVVTVRYFEHE
jgi:D-3-phosphoglycerate dehydrogenase